MGTSAALDVVTVTLNPAIDRTLTVPNFTAGAVNRVDAERDTPGGKGVNVASSLADFGLRVGVTGFLGRDNSSGFEALFARKKIEDRFVRIAGCTRVGIKITDPAHKLTTDINFPGLAPDPAHIAALRETLSALNPTWWVVAGSIPPGLDPRIYREIIAALKKRGARVALDASGDALREGIEAAPNIVKPNFHELETLLGKHLASIDAIIEEARKLLGKGIDLVVVSMGKDGASFVSATDAIIARPPDVDVGSTVGAGDAMVAGIVAAQIRACSLEDCARLASAFALQILIGAEPASLTKEAITESMKQITVN